MSATTPPPSDARRAAWARIGVVLLVAAAAAVIATIYAREGADGDPVSLPASGVVLVVLLAGTWWSTRWAWMPLLMLLPAVWVAVSGPLAVSGEDDSLVLPFVLQAVGLLVVLGCCRHGLQERSKVRLPAPAPYQPPSWPPGRGPGPGPSQAVSFPSWGSAAPSAGVASPVGPASAGLQMNPAGAPMSRPAAAPNPGDQPRFRPMDPLGAHLLMENQRKGPAAAPPAAQRFDSVAPPAQQQPPQQRRSRHAPPRPTRY
ncbi:MAG: hypothetical protein ACR2P2_01085, partial [Nakamurella sp.]